MNLPSLTLNKVGGKWVALYIGEDADEAKKAAFKITNGDVASDGGLLFVRPEYTRKLRPAKVEAQKPVKAAKRGEA